MPLDPIADSELYARLLLPRAHGYPLWRPDPNNFLSEEYRSEGVRIGDVGVLTTDGGFDFLFNICVSKDHPINHRGVPDDFVPVDPDTLDYDGSDPFHNPGTDISSKSISRLDVQGEVGVSDTINTTPLPLAVTGGFEFKASSTEGAILMLPAGGSRVNLRNKQPFFAVAHQNAAEWYHYARFTRGRMISDDALYLITGCDKSKSWGVAAFSDSSRTAGFTLKLLPPGIGGATGSLTYTWQKPNSVAARSGPAYDPPTSNQCVFLRGFRIAIRQRFLGKPKVKVSVFEQSKPHATFTGDEMKHLSLSTSSSYPPSFGARRNSSRAASSSDAVLVEEFPKLPEPYHPLTGLNSLLLEKIGCATAITHDDIWLSVIDQVNGLPEVEDLLSAVLASYNVVVVDDTVSLEAANRDPESSKVMQPLHEFAKISIRQMDEGPPSASAVESSFDQPSLSSETSSPIHFSPSGGTNSFRVGRRVFYWGDRGQLYYGTVKSTEMLPDETLVLVIREDGTGRTIKLPAAGVTKVT